MTFPDIERLLAELLDDFGNCGSVVPEDLQDQLRYIQINRVGGGSDLVTDYPRVDVAVFAATGQDASETARDICSFLVDHPRRGAGGQIDTGQVELGPREIPWADPTIRRWVTTFVFTTRRIA